MVSATYRYKIRAITLKQQKANTCTTDADVVGDSSCICLWCFSSQELKGRYGSPKVFCYIEWFPPSPGSPTSSGPPKANFDSFLMVSVPQLALRVVPNMVPSEFLGLQLPSSLTVSHIVWDWWKLDSYRFWGGGTKLAISEIFHFYASFGKVGELAIIAESRCGVVVREMD